MLSLRFACSACRLTGADAWPLTPKLVKALRSVCRKLGSATEASVSSVIYPTPLGFTTVQGLGLQEGQHLAGEKGSGQQVRSCKASCGCPQLHHVLHL